MQPTDPADEPVLPPHVYRPGGAAGDPAGQGSSAGAPGPAMPGPAMPVPPGPAASAPPGAGPVAPGAEAGPGGIGPAGAPVPEIAGGAVAGDARKKKRTRLVLAMVGGILALLCLGGVGVFISFYDETTKIDRTAPDAVVDNFLGAYLVSRNDEQAQLYTCEQPDLSEVAGLRQEFRQREEDFGVTVSVSWESLSVSDAENANKNVAVDLTVAGTSNGNAISSRTDAWEFEVVDRDGWRVCDARKLP